MARVQHELQQARDAENFERQRKLQLELKKLEFEFQYEMKSLESQNQFALGERNFQYQ